MLQPSNYSLVLSLQLVLLLYDLLVNAFSELLRATPVMQLVLFIIQDICILFNIIIIFLMFFNTFVFQAGLISLLFRKFKGTIILTAIYLALSIPLHVTCAGKAPSHLSGRMAFRPCLCSKDWLPFCIATSTRGQPFTWGTLGSTRILCGCARSSPKSETDPAARSHTWAPPVRIPGGSEFRGELTCPSPSLPSPHNPSSPQLPSCSESFY
ncbi:transmembrane protein 138 isoform X1 [Sminthopsis crassicaudata]|uniref:transmembrane protein 138 isoform X1 n=1 Tax=Sminthopsis crassicaudata TaxID=9301 RepID=UPI003D6936C1